MGRGRAPCCDKTQVKRGPWSPAEDLRLITFIQKFGHENWRALPKQAGLLRCGKSCRLRWINYLRPDVKRGNFTKEEEETVIKLHKALGNRWSKIASHLPGRTDNEIKNVWNTHLKKRFSSKKNTASDHDQISKESSSITSSSSLSSSSNSDLSSGNKHSFGSAELVGNDIQSDHHHHKDLEKNIDDHDHDPHHHHAQMKKDPLKEVASTSLSVSSYDSNGSNNSSQVVEVSKPDDHDDDDYDHQEKYMDLMLLDYDVNKPDDDHDQVPLEADFDFWDMLDNLCPFQPNINNHQVHCHSSSFEAEHSREIENKKWFRYLENELGLEATATAKENDIDDDDDDDENQQELVAKDDVKETFHCDHIEEEARVVVQESDPSLTTTTYCPMWPSLPKKSPI